MLNTKDQDFSQDNILKNLEYASPKTTTKKNKKMLKYSNPHKNKHISYTSPRKKTQASKNYYQDYEDE
jgi:hypothetical protein